MNVKNQNISNTTTQSMKVMKKLTAQCTKTRQMFSKNRTETSARKSNSSQLPLRTLSRVHKKKVFDQFISFDEKRKKWLYPQELRPFCLNTTKNINRISSTNATRDVAVQTESLNDHNVSIKEENVQKIGLARSIDYLKKNLVGHVVKITGNTFRINECSITLTKEDSDFKGNEIIIVQPDKLISSSLRFLDSLRPINSAEPRLIEEDVAMTSNNGTSALSQKPCVNKDVITDCDIEISEDIGEIKDNGTQKATGKVKEISDLDFNKKISVLLHKLPEDVVEASRKGQTMKIKTVEKNGLENESSYHCNIEEIAEIIPQVLSVELSECSDLNNEDVSLDNPAKMVIRNSEIYNEIPTKELKIGIEHNTGDNPAKMDIRNNEIYNEIPKEELKTGIEHNTEKKKRFEGNELHCDMCNHKFKLFQSLKYHKQVKHGNVDFMSIKCEICNSFYESCYYNYVHKEECLKKKQCEEKCPKCPDTLKDKKDLFNHLLKNHRVVLKKDEYECDLCMKKFITYKSLLYHNEKSHNVTTSQENVVFKVKCENCNQLFDFKYYKNEHISKCNRNKEGKEGNTESIDTMVQTSMTIQSNLPATKRKYQYSSPEDGIINKRLSLVEKSVVGELSREISTKLEALLGANDGPNQITIINLDN